MTLLLTYTSPMQHLVTLLCTPSKECQVLIEWTHNRQTKTGKILEWGLGILDPLN